jgi:hypothetical protein
MKFKHILAFAVHGLTSSSLEEDIDLIVTDEPEVRAMLLKDPDKNLYIIDRGLALATLMLRGFFGEAKEGERAQLLEEEVAQIRSKWKKQAKGASILVIDITGDIEADLSGAQRETADFVVIFDAVDKEHLRSLHAPFVSSIVASISLALPRIEPIEKLRDGIYLLDSDGKIYHSFTPSLGAVSVRVSSPLTTEILEAARFYGEALLHRPNMARVIRLFHHSIDESSDKLRSFLSAWAALEILINKTFSGYESQFIDAIKQAAPSHALYAYLDRVSEVMSGKYRLLDRFIIVSHFLAESSSDADTRQFKEIKDMRDRLLHGADILEADLPVHETQDLLHRYITGHLRLSSG